MAKYLLDANIISEPIRPRPNSRVVDHMSIHQDDVVTAAPVWSELLFGCYRLPDSALRDRIEDYLLNSILPTIRILPFDDRAAEWHAAERARLSAAGLTPPFVDGQIAAVAYVNNLILVTANTRDFENFAGLQTEDWTRT